TLASNAAGVLIQHANLGLILFSTIESSSGSPVHTSTYAASAIGNVSLLGIPGLTLSGLLGVESDTAGAVDQTLDIPDPKNPGQTIAVPVVFTGNMQGFSGTG